MNKRKEQSNHRPKSKKGLLIFIPLAILFFASAHEASVRYMQDVTCTVCHEMQEPIERWKASGTAENHNNCAGCHYDSGFKGWMEMNISAAEFLFLHFTRDKNEAIKSLAEPVFLEDGREPGYWSRVPNHRCYQCHDAKNHKKEDQPLVHEKVIKNIWDKPCMDCHNHEMRNGQKFYEKVLPDKVIKLG